MSRDYYDGTALESTLVRPLPCEYDIFISGQPLCAGGGPLLFPRAPQILLRGLQEAIISRLDSSLDPLNGISKLDIR